MTHCAISSPPTSEFGFSLGELMVAMSVLIVLVVSIMQITGSVMTTITRTSAQIDAFASARVGFDLVGQRLTQATLNTYWAYDDPYNPTAYLRMSDLQFLVRQNQQNSGYGQEIYFPAPESYSAESAVRSTSGLLNACSFFVQYSGNETFRPATASGGQTRYRYRLMQGLQPTEASLVFNNPCTGPTTEGWIAAICNPAGNAATSDTGSCVTPIAENVIAFVVWPRLSMLDDPEGTKLAGATQGYGYDSCPNALNALKIPQPITAHQLPPMVQVTMIMVSETAATRLDTKSSTPPEAIEAALRNRFQDVQQYEVDLQSVQDALTQSHIDYQVFTTTVPLKESKWSDAAQ